jgi:hypothetical protein
VYVKLYDFNTELETDSTIYIAWWTLADEITGSVLETIRNKRGKEFFNDYCPSENNDTDADGNDLLTSINNKLDDTITSHLRT